MNKKNKTVSIVIIVIILIATIGLAIEINKKNQALQTATNQKKAEGLFGEKSNIQPDQATGSVEAIFEKTMEIKKDDGSIMVVNINGSTPVVKGINVITSGQMADVKLQDKVRVQFDSKTNNTQLITIIDDMSNGTKSLADLYANCSVKCGQKSSCDGKNISVSGYIDYNNIADKKFILMDAQTIDASRITLEVSMANAGNFLTKIQKTTAKDKIVVTGIVESLDMPINKSCRKGFIMKIVDEKNLTI